MKKLKIALTGKLRIGKDYVATKSGGQIIGFADPLYKIGEKLTGYDDTHKDAVPFLRKLYQTIGQWGRGEVNEQYPWNMERAIFTALVKSDLFRDLCPEVNFDSWGSPDIWLNSLVTRAEQLDGNRIFCVNVRFKNELDHLVAGGWDHWHIACSRQTYEERLRDVAMSVNDPRLRDVSEQLAGLLDNSVVNTIKTEPVGPKLKVIWNDHRTSPSERLCSLEEFQKYIENYECEPEYTTYPEPDPSPSDDRACPSTDAECAAPTGADEPKDRDPADRRRKRAASKAAK